MVIVSSVLAVRIAILPNRVGGVLDDHRLPA